MPPRLLRIRELAKLLGVDPSHAYKLLSHNGGPVPTVRLGDHRGLRVRESDVLRFIAERTEAAPAAVDADEDEHVSRARRRIEALRDGGASS